MVSNIYYATIYDLFRQFHSPVANLIWQFTEKKILKIQIAHRQRNGLAVYLPYKIRCLRFEGMPKLWKILYHVFTVHTAHKHIHMSMPQRLASHWRDATTLSPQKKRDYTWQEEGKHHGKMANETNWEGMKDRDEMERQRRM